MKDNSNNKDMSLKNIHPAYLSTEEYERMKNSSDNELVKMIRNQVPRTGKQLVKRYRAKLFSYLYRFVGNKEEAEDLLQNVFIKIFLNLENFDTRKKFSSWAYRIAHNEAVNYLKKKNQKKFLSWEDITVGKDKMELRSHEKSPLDSWMKKELSSEIDEALGKLPLKYREVLILRYFSEKSYEEIGAILNKPVNTVGTIINRAKKKLLQIINKSWK